LSTGKDSSTGTADRRIRTLQGEGINFSYSGVSKTSPELAEIFGGKPLTVPFGLSSEYFNIN
jgi:hypothetical protein